MVDGYTRWERNQKCWCGSGIKYKKCHNSPPPKTLIVINGAPCVGKSTVRSAIAKLLPEPHWETDYDSFVKKKADRMGLRDGDNLCPAFDAAKEAVIKAAGQAVTVADILCDNTQLREFDAKAAFHEISTFKVLLHCQREERVRRDSVRRQNEPDVAYGFLDGMEPELNGELYDLILDSTNSKPDELAKAVLNAIWESDWQR